MLGQSTELQFGVLDSLKLNGVTLESVPVTITDISNFSDLYDDYEISGIIGIGAFKQFTATRDYINGRLILKPRGNNTQVESVSEISFTMASLQFMMCKATINGKEMNMFLDSGLVDDSASLLLAEASISYAGITIPETSANDETGGIEENGYQEGYFTADTFSMGDLPIVNDMIGIYGAFPENYYFADDLEIFVDGILSHNYLKNYIWTIDYETMTMTFSK